MILKRLYNRFLSPRKDFTNKLRDILGFTPTNLKLYELAFKHKSLYKKNNERLEFLGDAILDSVVSHEIFLHYPKKNEGDLSKLRSKAVKRTNLNKIGAELQLTQFLKYKIPRSASKPVNLEGNTLEALIGAVYEDVGYEKCYRFIYQRILKPYIIWDKLDREISDFKSILFNYTQRNAIEINFPVIEEASSANRRKFEVSVVLDGREVAKGKGLTKKGAEQDASKKALKILKVLK